MVDNFQKGGVPTGGDSLSSQNGAGNKVNIFKKTFQRLGAMALICVTSASLLAGCGSNDEDAPKEEKTAIEKQDDNKPVQGAEDNREKQIDVADEDESNESHYNNIDNYDPENTFDLEDLESEDKDKACIGITKNGIKFDLSDTLERTRKTLERHPGYRVLPFGGDYSEYAKTKNVDAFKEVFINDLNDMPHLLATNANFLLTNEQKQELGFKEGTDTPSEMYEQLLAKENGAEFQQSVLNKVSEVLKDATVTFETFEGECDSYGVVFIDKEGDVTPDNITIGKVHHEGDKFTIATIILKNGITVRIKLNCGLQPIEVIIQKITDIITPPPTNPPKPSDTITEGPKPTKIITPTEGPKPSDTITEGPTKIITPTEGPTKIITPTEGPKPSKIPEPSKGPDPSKAPEPSKIPEPSKGPDPSKIPEPSKVPKPTDTITQAPTATPIPSLEPKDKENRYNIEQEIKKDIKEEYGIGGNISIDNSDSNPSNEQPTEKKDSSNYNGTTFAPSMPPSWQQPTTTVEPTKEAQPTDEPTNVPTQVEQPKGDQGQDSSDEKKDSAEPVQGPTQAPTAIPVIPTEKNDFSSNNPTQEPAQNQGPTQAPAQNQDPTQGPTQEPTQEPTQNPTEMPVNPTAEPTYKPIEDDKKAQEDANKEQEGANNGEGVPQTTDEVTDDDLAGFNF